ncbi:hypothetical protein NVV94_10295 [Pseudomonas sp. LS1212]|uniref:hypothetical protein n=1 Tax=Pseudomonas sp. LS1212 TaxID=2972478 RepID=UPI00215CC74B|nr:hypothetical protein [Pseudomonas sp. LS1212]UVJ45894.1 hypothetical protein NVV94_10295 [Pseudomonas sp. LS1212]
MSTLNEIAANHARMAKALAEESTEPGERQPQIVGGFEVVSIDSQQHTPLHLIVGVQDRHLGHATGYLL